MVWTVRCVLIVGFLIPFLSPGIRGQEALASREAVRVFLDCQARGCRDFDFNRREIPWVSWVRDRRDADVHILVASTEAGGGTSYDITFLGRRRFTGEDTQLKLMSSSTDTSDERRRRLSERFKHGLLGYAARTDSADRLRVVFDAGDGESPTEAGDTQSGRDNDPWNLWVYSIRLGGRFSGESLRTSTTFNGGISARRTSVAWKFDMSADVRYRETEFDLAESTETSIVRSSSADALIVKTTGAHWGIGLRAGVSSSTFNNEDLRIRIQPAIEYDIFPYSASSERLLTLQYRIGPSVVRYDRETIFGKLEETLYEQSLTAGLEMTQPWGSANMSLSGTTFVDDFGTNALSVFGSVDFRIVRGLNLSVFGSASRVRNQVFLASKGATDTDILLRRQALETSFRYSTSFGLSYTFGSIFNNIVNPRLRSGF
ncbi:MAG: hypothetical protein BMS9Abin29_0873 [Gemmatimonadota bacterium]|nr:MAG: hypothetical protein BMS9Abin29_0873 [Gemmatimonadota bacterium]